LISAEENDFFRFFSQRQLPGSLFPETNICAGDQYALVHVAPGGGEGDRTGRSNRSGAGRLANFELFGTLMGRTVARKEFGTK
jgi:hypothetical protein